MPDTRDWTMMNELTRPHVYMGAFEIDMHREAVVGVS